MLGTFAIYICFFKTFLYQNSDILKSVFFDLSDLKNLFNIVLQNYYIQKFYYKKYSHYYSLLNIIDYIVFIYSRISH